MNTLFSSLKFQDNENVNWLTLYDKPAVMDWFSGGIVYFSVGESFPPNISYDFENESEWDFTFSLSKE